jgi:site-specific recombinase XerD
MRKRGVIRTAAAAAAPDPLVDRFCRWLRADRGVVETTVSSYRKYVSGLVTHLGDDPGTYTTRGLRDFVTRRYGHYGRHSIRMVLAAIRMFLRHLATEGRCRPGLEHALVSPANWSQEALPRGLSSEQVEQVLRACPLTRAGVRDRAILLLLIRLGLRAGDLVRLRWPDVCFHTATIRVSGKGRRESRLPLPQDVGDALLDYLRVRPCVQSERVFLRVVAPFGPLRSRSAVSHVARTAMRRAGVEHPSSGSHVLRHTAACRLLGQGVDLETIAFGTTWLLTIAITAAASEGSVTGDATELAAIPIVGPFIMADEKLLTEAGEIVYPLVGVLQMVGVGFTVWGAITLGGDAEPEAGGVTLAPAVGPGMYGMTIQGAF